MRRYLYGVMGLGVVFVVVILAWAHAGKYGATGKRHLAIQQTKTADRELQPAGQSAAEASRQVVSDAMVAKSNQLEANVASKLAHRQHTGTKSVDAALEDLEKKLAAATTDAERQSILDQFMTNQNAMAESLPMKEPDYSKVDLSGTSDINDKLEAILKRFDDSNSYTFDNPLVKQITQLGAEAIQPLLDMLANNDMDDSRREAVVNALGLMLTDQHKDIILKCFQEEGLFSDLVKRYRFPEAENIVMDKIAQGLQQSMNSGMDYVNNVIDMALMMNEDRAVSEIVTPKRKGITLHG